MPTRTDAAGEGGAWVRFADYRPLAQAPDAEHPVLGADHGELYVCALHLAAARERAALPVDDAVAALKALFAGEPRYVGDAASRGAGWKRRIGEFLGLNPRRMP
ncbi:hypothetical protein [Luteimonas aquatica]|uniref:hypothetical protein n=1 Tax=Luteimonas aquatica TaxID=450364 RepID=UPI001F592353|nr:hypothetical protein [Luteimonas aquatica]